MRDEDPRPVVANTTPIIALSAIGRLGLLRELYHRVLVPAAVARELRAGGTLPGSEALAENPWIGERAIAGATRRAYLVGLDDGEAEAIVLAEELQARLLILDEALA